MKLKIKEFLNKVDALGVSHSVFAGRCGVSRQAVASWIKELRYPKYKNVKAMADVLHCNIEDIAYPDDDLERVALHGDGFAQAILGATGKAGQNKHICVDDEFTALLLKYLADQLAKQISATSQSEVARHIGLSASQINRITHGKADLNLLPIGALYRLCPQIIDREVLLNSMLPEENDALAATKIRIKTLIEQIYDIHTAKTVENMLRGIVPE